VVPDGSTDEGPPEGADPGQQPQQTREPEGRDPWLRFAVTFAVLAVASELVYYGVALESPIFKSYLSALARANGFLLGLVVDEVSVHGTRITSSFFSVEIARGCDAYRICALLSSAIIAFPAPVRTKAWGLFLGLLWLNMLNFVRIISLFFIGGNFYAHFKATHEIYFPVFLIAMTVAAWIVFVRRATRDSFGVEPDAL
jgi:exosortase/archaeosortase family protein